MFFIDLSINMLIGFDMYNNHDLCTRDTEKSHILCTMGSNFWKWIHSSMMHFHLNNILVNFVMHLKFIDQIQGTQKNEILPSIKSIPRNSVSVNAVSLL